MSLASAIRTSSHEPHLNESRQSSSARATIHPSGYRTFTYTDNVTPGECDPSVLEPYQYAPLLGSDEVRILDMLPASALDEPIQGHMRTTALSSITYSAEHRYQAVSYAWGQSYDNGAHLTRYILCDQKRLWVTASLHAALTMIRGHLDVGNLFIYATRPSIWADAICIDQANVEERNHQVPLMTQIYKKCSRLLIWLGEADQIDACKLTHGLSWVCSPQAE